jgi:hypothetical protein
MGCSRHIHGHENEPIAHITHGLHVQGEESFPAIVVLGHANFLHGRTFDLDENPVNSANDAREHAHIPTLSQRKFICEFA